MKESTEQYVKSLAHTDVLRYPDFEMMWDQIEAKRLKPSVTRNRKRTRVMTVAITCTVVLAVTVPVMAQNVSWEWMRSLNRTGVITALEQGFGQQIEKRVVDRGVELTLHTAVSDENRLALNYSFLIPNSLQYEIATFGHVELRSVDGSPIAGHAVNKQDPESGRLVGFFETDNTPDEENTKLTFTIKDIEWLRRAEKSVGIDPQMTVPQKFSEITSEIPSITVTSIKREQNKVTIRYTLPLNPERFSRLNPRLILKSGGQSTLSSYGTVFPNSEGQSEKQEVFLLDQSYGDDVQFAISFLESAGRVEGEWKVPFNLETDLAKQNTYKKSLNGEFPDGPRSQQLDELIVTPSMIKVNTVAEAFDNKWVELITYNKRQLQLGDQLIDGGRFVEGKGHSYRFEVPTGLKLAGEPMKMILSNVHIQKRGGKEHQVKLTQPSTMKQTAHTLLDGHSVRYTYYLVGQDLIVETSSDDVNFGGIVQTNIIVDGKPIWADEREKQGPVGTSGNRSIERYKDLGEEDLIIYPYTYSIFDSKAKLELPLIP